MIRRVSRIESGGSEERNFEASLSRRREQWQKVRNELNTGGGSPFFIPLQGRIREENPFQLAPPSSARVSC